MFIGFFCGLLALLGAKIDCLFLMDLGVAGFFLGIGMPPLCRIGPVLDDERTFFFFFTLPKDKDDGD